MVDSQQENQEVDFNRNKFKQEVKETLADSSTTVRILQNGLNTMMRETPDDGKRIIQNFVLERGRQPRSLEKPFKMGLCLEINQQVDELAAQQVDAKIKAEDERLTGEVDDLEAKGKNADEEVSELEKTDEQTRNDYEESQEKSSEFEQEISTFTEAAKEKLGQRELDSIFSIPDKDEVVEKKGRLRKYMKPLDLEPELKKFMINYF